MINLEKSSSINKRPVLSKPGRSVGALSRSVSLRSESLGSSLAKTVGIGASLSNLKSTAPTSPDHTVMIEGVTSNLLENALQAKQRDGSLKVVDIPTSKTSNRDVILPVDGVPSKNRSQGRYMLRPSVNNVISASIEGGNQFAALVLLVLENVSDEEATDVQIALNATHLAPEPQTRRQAMSGMEADEWLAAEKLEISSMLENSVFIECVLPSGRRAIHSKWVYKRKRDKNGAIERYKMRLVAQGFSQVEGFDYNETYSPVARFTSIRFILAISSILGLIVHQMDVETAFLNAELKEEIYMHPPVGMTIKDGHVLRLLKTLYGLKQSPREWNANLDKFMISMLFTRITADACVCIRKSDKGAVIIAVYVDDLIIAGSSLRLVESVKSAFHRRYKMKDMGVLEYVLGVRVDQQPDKNIIQLSQKTYILDMLTKYDVKDARAVDTPMSSNVRLTKGMCPTTSQGRLDMEKYLYREAVGSLLWIANGTRPDVAFAVSQVAKYMSNPGMEHWDAVKRILRYL